MAIDLSQSAKASLAKVDTFDTRITNNTDAITNLQAADALNVKYDSADKGSITVGGTNATAPVTINNVKAGALSDTSTEAVNGSQLYATNQQVIANTDAINNIGSAFNKVHKEIGKVDANSAALAGLKPLQYDPMNRNQFMAAVGHYKNANTVALGGAHFNDESTMFHVGLSSGGGETMINAGVSVRFGSSDAEKALPERYRSGPISSVYVMQDEVQALQSKNAELEAKNAAYEAQDKVQNDQIAEMQRKIDELAAMVRAGR